MNEFAKYKSISTRPRRRFFNLEKDDFVALFEVRKNKKLKVLNIIIMSSFFGCYNDEPTNYTASQL